VLRPENLPIADLEEITPLTIPEDYVRKNRPPIHRCWRMRVKADGPGPG
jgi:hypothetical protein